MKTNSSLVIIHCQDRYLIFIIAGFLLNSCAGLSSIYNYDYPLTRQTAVSKTTGLVLNLPSGWRQVDANDTEFIDLLIVDDANDESISLTPISGIINTNARENDGLSKVKEYYLAFVEANSSDYKFLREEAFEISAGKFLAVEYSSKFINKRDVIFERGEKFFVLSAFSMTNSNIQQIFSVQNSILKSINISNGSSRK